MTVTADIARAIDILRNGGIGVVPTDTIYGVVASAYDRDAVERLYRVRKRDHNKPVLVLIDSIDRIDDFGVQVDQTMRALLGKIWSNDCALRTDICTDLGITSIDRPISVVLPNDDDRFTHIHRGHRSIGFRIPQTNSQTMYLLSAVGPLVAPSANISGQEMINEIDHIRERFGNSVDFYLSYQYTEVNVQASAIITMKNGVVSILRA